jgi:1-deoxy-D-xylulose-5-phosphate synthase
MAEKLGKVLTVEENVLEGGFGSAVLELFWERGLPWVTVKRIGVPDRFVEHGPQETLRGMFGINTEGIERAVRGIVAGIQGMVRFGKGAGLR